MEEWIKEFTESLRIRLEQFLVPNKEFKLIEATFFKTYGDKRIKVKISIENGEEK